MIELARQPPASDSEEVDCPEFESTLLLMDGELAGLPRMNALAHVRSCLVCRPLVSGWPAVAQLLEDRFAEAAELAKPDLAGLPAEVMRRVDAEAVAHLRPTLLAAVRHPSARPFLLGSAMAAAVLAIVLLPPASHSPVTSSVSSVDFSASTPPRPVAVAELPPGDPLAVPNANGLHLHKLEFDGADGMVYRTENDGMTVIWVTEHDGV